MQIIKMLITGDVNAGKTEFIRTISEIDIVSTDAKTTDEFAELKDETTVAMDFGRLTIDDELVLHLYGTPGQARFDFMWDILSSGILGYIVLIDSTRPQTLPATRRMLDFFNEATNNECPFVICANKQDQPGAFSPDDIRDMLSLHDSVPILPTIATEKKYVRSALLELFEMVLQTAE